MERLGAISVRMWRLALIVLFLGAAPLSAFAADSSQTAIPDRALWPDPINSPAAFDRASRAEILVFAHALAESETLDEAAMKSRLGIDVIDIPSIQRMQHQLWEILVGNYRKAAAGCVANEVFCPGDSGPGDLRAAVTVFYAGIPARYRPWFDDATQFHRAYLNELLGLAAVFPRANSEVETFNDNELQGWELPDRHFLLSFDDGPTRSSAPDGQPVDNTDLTLDMLRRNQVNAIFFALGHRFQARLQGSSPAAMQTLYSGMCVGIHGWLHKSHATWPQWKESILSTAKLIGDTIPKSYVPAFRPPYGQRRPDSGPFFRSHGIKVVLWNIDSHDWQDDLSPDQVEQREMSLILLWRRGFLLFHDFFPRSHVVVPRLIAWLAHDDITFEDCHNMHWWDTAPPAAKP